MDIGLIFKIQIKSDDLIYLFLNDFNKNDTKVSIS
jgi:hypothetical protein